MDLFALTCIHIRKTWGKEKPRIYPEDVHGRTFIDEASQNSGI